MSSVCVIVSRVTGLMTKALRGLAAIVANWKRTE